MIFFRRRDQHVAWRLNSSQTSRVHSIIGLMQTGSVGEGQCFIRFHRCVHNLLKDTKVNESQLQRKPVDKCNADRVEALVQHEWCSFAGGFQTGCHKEGKTSQSTRAWLNYSKRERSMQFPHRSNFCTQHGGPDTFNACHHGKYLWQIRDLIRLQIAERSTTCGMCSWAIVQIKRYFSGIIISHSRWLQPDWRSRSGFQTFFFSFYVFQVHRVFNWKLQSCYAYKP